MAPSGMDAAAGAPRPVPQPQLTAALAALESALDLLAAVDVAAEDDRVVLDATVTVQRQANRLAALQLDVVGRADLTGTYLDDGAATLAAWLRSRTRCDAGECSRRVTAAARLWRFPVLAAAARAGEVSAAHLTAVTSAAVPRRAAAVAAHDEVLTLLARHAPPRDVKVALTRIADHADAGGVDQPSETFDPTRPDPRCELWLRPGIDGLGDLQATLSQLDTEGLLTLLDALETPDPPGTPDDHRRSAAQRRGDAFAELIRRALGHGLAPTVHGVKPQVLLALDLAALLPAAERGALDLADLFDKANISDDLLRAAGVDPATLHLDRAGAATTEGDDDSDVGATADVPPLSGSHAAGHTADSPPPAPRPPRPRARLRFTGDIEPDTARHLLLDGVAVRCVLTMGPWRTIAVGRTMRTLPAWLRPLLDLVHQHCRGPDCDRPITWTQAHHQTAWADRGHTDVNQTIPLCQRHHDLVTTGRWDARLDPDTGVVTWTSPTGVTHHSRPPP